MLYEVITEQDTLETYYIDGSALFSVAIDEEKRISYNFV